MEHGSATDTTKPGLVEFACLGYYNSWSSEAMVMRLAREEGLFAGTSTGCNVIVALRSAEQLGSDASIVTVMCDTGMKYLKTFGKQKAESRK